MMAYLAMMAVRLLELHRVLKSTGSQYLHCDSTL
jgi:site-specific DNA-methyltransferase (adenine-specific)